MVLASLPGLCVTRTLFGFRLSEIGFYVMWIQTLL